MSDNIIKVNDHIGNELRAISNEVNFEDIKRLLDETITIHAGEMKTAATQGRKSFSLNYLEAKEIVPHIYKRSREVITYIINKYDLNITATQGFLNEDYELTFSWEYPASIEHCNFSAIR